MSNRATDNEHQEETLIKVINPLGLQPRKIWQFVALQTDEKPLTRVLGSLTHTIGGRGSVRAACRRVLHGSDGASLYQGLRPQDS